jgi:uncharacterized MAPEG superfamily protein
VTTDLTMLVLSAVLCLLIPGVYGFGRTRVPGGNAWGLGNRETPFEVPPWVARAQRAHLNLVENLAPFAALVLAAHVTLASSELTALGASIFFGARVAHAISYIAGIIYLRTLMFLVSLVGQVLIFVELLPLLF